MPRKVTLTPAETVTPPEPGVYEGVSFDLYKAWPLLNQSTLKWGLTSAQHLKAAMDGLIARSDTDAQRLGRALHSKILEPETFDQEWVFSEGCCAEIKSGARKGDTCGAEASYREMTDGGEARWYCGVHAKGKDVHESPNRLSWDQIEDIDAVCDAMVKHPVIRLLRQHGGHEVSVVWDAEGFPAKSRLDKWITGDDGKWPATVVDLKKCRIGHGGCDKFADAMRAYGYDIQAAWYVDAVAQVTGKHAKFVWVTVEEQFPYSVNVMQCDAATLAFGRERYQRLLELLRRGQTTGHWPGHMRGLEIGSVGLPDWFIKREREKPL